jgi:hypothetical protein
MFQYESSFTGYRQTSNLLQASIPAIHKHGQSPVEAKAEQPIRYFFCRSRTAPTTAFT